MRKAHVGFTHFLQFLGVVRLGSTEALHFCHVDRPEEGEVQRTWCWENVNVRSHPEIKQRFTILIGNLVTPPIRPSVPTVWVVTPQLIWLGSRHSSVHHSQTWIRVKVAFDWIILSS